MEPVSHLGKALLYALPGWCELVSIALCVGMLTSVLWIIGPARREKGPRVPNHLVDLMRRLLLIGGVVMTECRYDITFNTADLRRRAIPRQDDLNLLIPWSISPRNECLGVSMRTSRFHRASPDQLSFPLLRTGRFWIISDLL